MSERCMFCGEIAVIEEAIDGGKDQLICIECGTLAGDVQASKSFDFEEDNHFEGNINDKSNTVFNECTSCGIELDVSSNDHRNGGFSSKLGKLCTDCAELDDLEYNVENTKRSHVHSEDSTATDSINLKCQDTTVEISLGRTTNESKSKCLSCGSVNLTMDSVGGDDRLICTDCGQVNSNAVLTAESYDRSIANVGGTFTKYHMATLPNFARQQRTQEGLLVGLGQISKLCTKFCFPSNLKSEANDMYKMLYSHPKILNITYRKKEYVAAVCLFIVCRQFNLPVSITHFKEEVANYSLFLKMKKFLQKKINISLPHVSVGIQIAEMVERLKFDQALTNKMKDILFIFRKAWLTSGRNRKGLISMAAYYAYVSSSKCPKFVSWNEYCTTNKLTGTSRLLVRECQGTMCKLASSLPWISSKTVTPRKLPGYIDSVLEYRESLFHLVFKSDDISSVETKPIVTQPSSSSSSLVRMSDVAFGGAPLNVKPLVLHSEKEYLLPSSAKKLKLKPVAEEIYCPIPSDVNLDSPILRETEFEDEISSYILSTEEQERLREHKLKVMLN